MWLGMSSIREVFLKGNIIYKSKIQPGFSLVPFRTTTPSRPIECSIGVDVLGYVI